MADIHRLPARYYARLCDVLETKGIDRTQLLAACGIDDRQLRTADAELSLRQVERLINEALHLGGRSSLGLDLARALKLTSHSAVSYGILSSPTVGYALHLVARFFGLILPAFRMRYASDREAMRITVTPQWPMSPAVLAVHLEVIAASLHRELRDLTAAELPAYDCYFSFSEPPHSDQYAQLRQMRPHFGWLERPGLVMEWPVQLAGRPVALSDPGALKLAEQRCTDLVSQARAAGHVSGWVTMMLHQASNGLPSQTELADALNLSTRTLDRYLKKEGNSFRQLCREARRDRACELLRDTHVSVTQVAFELGYTDVSNFARAFRREMGASPGDWQARHAGS